MTNESRKEFGWVKINRSIQDNWVWDEKPFSKGQAWIDLILLAKHKEEKFLDRRGNLVDGERGYIYRSERSLAERWGWSRCKTSKFLSQLSEDEMIEFNKKKASEKTTIFIINYDKYQDVKTSKKTSQKPVADQQQTSSRPVAGIYKNVKNDKECNKNNKEDPAVLHSLNKRAEEMDEGEWIDFTNWKEGDPIESI